MRTIFNCFVVVLGLLVSGCESAKPDPLDGKLLRDSEGNWYRAKEIYARGYKNGFLLETIKPEDVNKIKSEIDTLEKLNTQ
jgi:hypothetical protein